MRYFLAMLLTAVLATQAIAGPDGSVRPVARTVKAPASITDRLTPTIRPALRPDLTEAALAAQLVKRFARYEPVPRNQPLAEFPGYEGTNIRAFATASPLAVIRTSRPARRTKSLVRKAMARQREKDRGALCGDPEIQGEFVGYVPGRIGGCGIEDAVEVRSVAGVALSQRSVLHCSAARALKTWVKRGAKPAVGNAGGGIAELRVAAHYACRTRNNQRGAKISEHGKGRAIDISAIRLRDGTELTVLGGYRSSGQGPMLRRMYSAACGIFGTTLGPDADRFHQDHFHFDTAKYRSGAYCR
ncbi:extensin-like domain-containing protein [Roseivivax sp. CAU 1753]